MKCWKSWGLAGLAGAVFAAAAAAAEVGPKLAVKFVVVTDLDLALKHGHPGLYQAWVAGEHFGTTFSSPGVEHAIKGDGQGSFAVVVGSGAQAAVELMALGLDERFDFTHAYWLLTGIGYGNPDQLSLGGVAWGTEVVNGDQAFELDRADAPGDWPYGVVPLGRTNMPADFPVPTPKAPAGVLYPLNTALTKMAYILSKDAKLADLPAAKPYRGTFAGYEGAVRPPEILSGSVVGTARPWHGKTLNQWATDWVQFWSKKKDPFLLSDSSDQASLAALSALAKMGRVDLRRIMVERGAWAFTLQAPNQSKDKSLEPDFPGLGLAATNAFLAARPIFHEITGHWDRYADQAP